ncbi:MAG: cyclophilin-like fold protein [Thermoplasmata archaeon]
MRRFRLIAGEVVLEGTLTDENPRTVEAVLNNLPVEGEVTRWGNEIYFNTDMELPEENGRQDVEIGEVAFWPAGKAIAIFFGKTPASISDKPRAFENVNVIGKLEGDPSPLREVKSGEPILIQMA